MNSRGPRPDSRTASAGESNPAGTTSRRDTARRRARTTFGWPMSPTKVLISREDNPARCASTIAESRTKARYIVVCARSLVFLFSLDEALTHVVHFRR